MALMFPIFSAGEAMGGIASFFKDRATLHEEIYTLTEERDALQNENKNLRVAIEEYRAFSDTSGIVARVVARPPTTPYDVLVVDQGTDDGVRVDAVVFAKAGIPVGVVADASATVARVALFSSSGRHSDGWVGSEHIPVSFIGQGAGAFIAEVARETDIQEGDVTYVVKGSGAFGVVVKVESDASSPQATLHIRPFVNPFSLTSVSIGRTP